MRVDEAIYLLAGYGANINPNNPVAEAVKMGIEALEGLPSAQAKLDEWCTDCKEYDHEKHCCPRYNRVIRETVKEIRAERMKGQWIDMGDFEQCSVCGGTHLKEFQSYYGKTKWIKTNYCPNCGADLRGEQE